MRFTKTRAVPHCRVELLVRQEEMLLDELPITAIVEMIENDVDGSSSAGTGKKPSS